jgi:hypothetical protein
VFGVSGVGVHDGSRGGVCFLGWCGAALPVLGGAGVVDAVCRAGLTRATDLIYIGESAKIPLQCPAVPLPDECATSVVVRARWSGTSLSSGSIPGAFAVAVTVSRLLLSSSARNASVRSSWFPEQPSRRPSGGSCSTYTSLRPISTQGRPSASSIDRQAPGGVSLVTWARGPRTAGGGAHGLHGRLLSPPVWSDRLPARNRRRGRASDLTRRRGGSLRRVRPVS